MGLHRTRTLEPDSEEQPEDRLASILANIAAALVALPMLVVIVTRWGSDYFPVQDLAVIDLRLRDVLSLDVPLVGAYSQFGWNHPGPALYLILKPFLLLSGGAAWGMVVGSAVIHGVTLISTVVIAKRSAGPRWALAWAVVCALSFVPMGPWMLFEAWNPHLAYPMFILFALLSWRFLCVPGSYSIWIAVVATLLVQLHVGYVPLVGAIGMALVWTYWRERGSESSTTVIPLPVGGLVVVLVTLWALPLIDAVVNRGGNVRALFRYFVLGGGEQSRAGTALAGRLIASEFRVLPAWLGGPTDMDPLTALSDGASAFWLIVPALLVSVGALLYARCGMSVRRLLTLSWIGLGSGMLALVLLRGKVAPYLFYWRTPVAILLVLGVATAGWSVLVPRLKWDPRRFLEFGAVAVVAGAVVLLAIDVARAPRNVMVFEQITRELTEQVDVAEGPVIIRWAGSPLSGLQAGALDELERRELPVGVDRGLGFQFGNHREIDTSDAAQIWYASEQGFVTATLERLPGSRVIARVTPLDVADDKELSDLQARAVEQLNAAGRPDIIEKLDSPLAVLDLDELAILTPAERRRFVALTEEVERSGVYRAALVGFQPDQAPAREDLSFLEPG